MIEKLKNKTCQIKQTEVLKYVLFTASVFIFGYIAHENVLENEMQFDNQIKLFVSENETPNLISIMHAITFFGSSKFLFPSYLTVIAYFILKKNMNYAKSITFIGLGSLVLQIGFKFIFKRTRPQTPIYGPEFGYSFPSGHALSSFVFCSFLSFLIWHSTIKTMWKYLFIFLLFLLTILVGASRIVLNVHYATDIIAGFCLGIIWMMLCFWFLKYWFKYS